MNKIISKVITMGLIFSSMLSISGCEEYKSNEKHQEEEIAKVIKCIDSRDPQKIKSLFAPNAVKVISDLDESITELLSYYKGEYVSNRRKGLTVSSANDHNGYTKDLDISQDITTSEDIYRVALTDYRAEDTGDKKNIGLWRFFIIRFEDDPNPDYSYWGDLRKENGIFIGTFRIIEEPTEEMGIYE